MKVVSFNVNSIRARLDRFLNWMKLNRPDVICLQELKVADESFPQEVATLKGYNIIFHGQKAYNGVAIMARSEILQPQLGFPRFEGSSFVDPHSRFISAVVNDLRIVSVYCPNGQEVGSQAFQYKLNWFQHLYEYLSKCEDPKKDILICGDFNIAPQDIDVYDPVRWKDKLHCSEPERAALKKLMSWGLYDTFREKEPNTQAFSWWDYRSLGFAKNHGLRIDLILATKGLMQRCKSVGIDREERKGEKPSDHVPVIAEFAD